MRRLLFVKHTQTWPKVPGRYRVLFGNRIAAPCRNHFRSIRFLRLINNVSRNEKAIRVTLLEFDDWASGSASEHGKIVLEFVAGFSMLVIDKS
jgi:hypothetical protein